MDRYVGLDVHAASCTAAVVGPSGRRLTSRVLETNARSLIAFLQTLPRPRHVCLEEGTHVAWLHGDVVPPRGGARSDRGGEESRADERSTGCVRLGRCPSPRGDRDARVQGSRGVQEAAGAESSVHDARRRLGPLPEPDQERVSLAGHRDGGQGRVRRVEPFGMAFEAAAGASSAGGDSLSPARRDEGLGGRCGQGDGARSATARGLPRPDDVPRNGFDPRVPDDADRDHAVSLPEQAIVLGVCGNGHRHEELLRLGAHRSRGVGAGRGPADARPHAPRQPDAEDTLQGSGDYHHRTRTLRRSAVPTLCATARRGHEAEPWPS